MTSLLDLGRSVHDLFYIRNPKSEIRNVSVSPSLRIPESILFMPLGDTSYAPP